MRVADYVADSLHKAGVRHVFMVSGGGMMFLSDGLAQNPNLEVVCNHHEQASAMAAVAYAKYTGHLCAAYVTTGCGGTNALTGVLNGWQDSAPCLFVSGQSKRKETVRNSGLKLRQFGVQEADIIPIVESVTKYAVMVNDPQEIAYHLEKAIHLATTGRPGPVWLDIPMDVQGAIIEPSTLKHFSPEETAGSVRMNPSPEEIAEISKLIGRARRPIIVVGQGVRISGALRELREFIEQRQIPTVATRLGIDCLPSDHPLYVGRIGNKGDRAGNFAVQNSDLVVAIGSRLSVSSTGHEYRTFAREAKIVVVDIDPVEHQKKTVRIDLFVQADAKCFLTALLTPAGPSTTRPWADLCRKWRDIWPVCLPEYARDGQVNLYYFTDRLSNLLRDDSVVISDAGSAFYVCSQGLKLHGNQRYITSGGQAEMGYTLPAAIGVSMARNCGEVIGVTGDGSFQMNIQELQTVVHRKLPIKLFVWNNDGYLSIRATQSKFFQGRLIGTDSTSGVSFPDIGRIAGAYGIKYFKIADNLDTAKIIEQVLASPGPVLCEVVCLRDQEIVPTVSSAKMEDGTLISKPLEDMYPFLDRKEFLENMIIKPLDGSA